MLDTPMNHTSNVCILKYLIISVYGQSITFVFLYPRRNATASKAIKRTGMALICYTARTFQAAKDMIQDSLETSETANAA